MPGDGELADGGDEAREDCSRPPLAPSALPGPRQSAFAAAPLC